ncbi:MAG: DUF503 domain-containing protein [Candidatus Aquicultor sp.]|nr:DUF503 domain-containing protein [Candidatus Aquicultor sp.]
MIVGLLRLELYLPGTNSLKEKRQIVKSVIGKVESRYNVSISEVDHHELWQRVTIGIAHVAQKGEQTKKVLDSVDRYVEGLDKAVITEREILLFSPET